MANYVTIERRAHQEFKTPWQINNILLNN